jgi:hypothetical protein
METTERIVEAYVRHLKRWATIPNIRCDGQYEIDLLAIDPVSGARFHIETSVSGSQAFSKLTAKEFSVERLKVRVQQASQRRTLGFFVDRKFRVPEVTRRLADYGFAEGNHRKIIVTWGWTDDAKIAADRADVELWDFRKILKDIASSLKNNRSYFTDDTLRTISLFIRADTSAA